ncbi:MULTISPECIES: 16S rRNA (guanine(527)-N(7))-methyltransferase RsmG [unclassified Pseudactinotalea]|uniref:16S rRNA (guanine(527)-N(7))-methyltransferase RsmG n=1 Tax=unclassified Pseudactinotalea TaxID=2649176 RepID=UPI00128E2DC2|nr:MULTISPECIES: 16S rRNA (guanine(527)-N(7))-methyltransferase RsmG [unclassified Pseudactinotalea]MPV51436.1 16S rRNA (guanine(527)-N(7))-methyltransferase RsmG [Pseudactinotalea sp. HY160]QGH70838.1 16S rRNA (guanine(527)-N(7))-methyltransferase RsmG [Pseudactinotalea sp. HY158]
MSDLIGDDEARSREILGVAFGGVEHFGEMLAAEGELRGLIGPRELPRLWRRHLMNSAAVAQFLPASGAVADVGSGAGLPGVVLALLRPDLEMHLIEPMERRVEWLIEVTEELGLDNVTLHRARAEEVHGRLRCEAVTARAVAGLGKLLRFTMPLVAPGGSLLALKGERARDEVDEATYVLKKFRAREVVVHDVDLFDDADVTRVVEVRR